MDCIQANLGLALDVWRGEGAHRWLGAVVEFRPDRGGGILPAVEPSVNSRLSEAVRAGLRIGEPRKAHSAAELSGSAEPLFVVGDAFEMSWVPYCGHQHMEHSFLVLPNEAGEPAAIADAYYNDTEWGAARPGMWRLPGDAELTGDAELVARPLAPADPAGTDPAAVLAANAEHLAAAAAEVPGYVTAHRELPDQVAALEHLTLETWLLARSRALHASWLAWRISPEVARPVAEHARSWSELAAQVFMALRRARRGRTPSDVHSELSRLLEAEPVLFARLAEDGTVERRTA